MSSDIAVDGGVDRDQSIWRRRNCPGLTVALQKLMGIDGKYFDELTLMSEDEVRVVYFDVSYLFWKKGDGL